MANFDFITNDEFRESLKADYAEMNKCFEVQAWKAVHVLAGSIIEALLLDYLIASCFNNQPSADNLKMQLGPIIKECRAKGIVTEKAEQLSTIVQSYRNLIHTGRVIRLGEIVDGNGAVIAKSLVEIIVDEVAANKKATYGYTAEQIVGLIEKDKQKISIIHHILKGMKEHEIERLLIQVIPKYLEEADPFDYDIEEGKNEISKCFRIAFEQASQTIKDKATNNFIAIVKTESQSYIRNYETAFFRITDCTNLDQNTVQLVVEHFIGQLSASINIPLLTCITGIGKHLSPNNVNQFLEPLSN